MPTKKRRRQSTSRFACLIAVTYSCSAHGRGSDSSSRGCGCALTGKAAARVALGSFAEVQRRMSEMFAIAARPIAFGDVLPAEGPRRSSAVTARLQPVDDDDDDDTKRRCRGDQPGPSGDHGGGGACLAQAPLDPSCHRVLFTAIVCSHDAVDQLRVACVLAAVANVSRASRHHAGGPRAVSEKVEIACGVVDVSLVRNDGATIKPATRPASGEAGGN